MGCASASGKIEQHACSKPVIISGCNSCGRCSDSCPVSAIKISETGASINYDKCIACNNCLGACPDELIRLNWSTMEEFIEGMAEYALGAVKNKTEKTGYMNFLMNITPECDCLPYSDSPIVLDIGIMVSNDPVALDAACYDMVNNQYGLENSMLKHNHQHGEDKFRGLWKNVDGRRQLQYGQKIGLGSLKYELIDIS